MTSREAAQPERDARWRERGQALRARIAEIIDAGAGEQSRPEERELFELVRTNGSLRGAATTAYMIGTQHQAAQDFAGAIAAFGDARVAFAELADAHGMAEADHGIALMYASTRKFDQAVRSMHESAAQLMQFGATQNAGRAHLSAAAFRMIGQRYMDAEPELDTADRLLSISYDDGHETFMFVAAVMLTRLAVLMREAQDAEAAIQRARELAADDRLFLAFVDDLTAQRALQQDDVPSYISALEQAAAKFQQCNEPRLAAVELCRLGLAFKQRGDQDAAERALRQSANLYFNVLPQVKESAARRVVPYLVVADIELDEEVLPRLARLRS